MLKSESLAFKVILFVALLVHFQGYLLGFFLDDPGLYAALSKNMVLSGNYADLQIYGQDWLDKPHFPFWCTALCFQLFGVSEFSYQLPVFIFFLAGSYYCFLFAKQKYNSQVAWVAILILVTAQYSFMTATEGRVENYLMAAIIGSIYHLDRWKNSSKHYADLIWGTLWVAVGVMTKGIFVLIPIIAALGIEVLIRRDFRHIPRLLLCIPFLGIFILPEIYVLYLQFDSQPDKVVFGQTNVSGISWFLWDSQFSRLVNDGPIQRAEGDPFFFLHTLLWAFMPWALLFMIAVGARIRKAFKQTLEEYYTLGGGLLMFLVSSISKFQLPHYLSILFPLYAIITAVFVVNSVSQLRKGYIFWVQAVQAGLLFVGLWVLQIIFAPGQWWISLLLSFFGIGIGTWITRSELPRFYKAVLFAGLIITLVNAYLHVSVYPLIIEKRADIQAARFINKNYLGYEVGVFGPVGHRFEFYTNDAIERDLTIEQLKTIPNKDSLLILCTQTQLLEQLNQQNIDYHIVRQWDFYPPEGITKEFIFHQNREESYIPYYLLKIQ